jgi:RNA polymerase subunit RPABC4/transcription elongation factor Spt4
VTSVWQCGHCRARIDRDTVECPRCGAPFSRA